MTHRCLIVEVDAIWVEILERSLQSLGVETHAVSRPEDAFAQLTGGNYDLVVVDLSLDLGKRFAWGTKLLADIKASNLNVPPIIIVSGTEEIDDVVDCINDYRHIVCYFARKISPWRHLRFIEAAKAILAADNRSRLPTRVVAPVFISHTGESDALSKLSEFLRAIGVPYVIAEKQPKRGKSVKAHVAEQMKRCGASILLKSKNTSRSVLVEQGQLEELFPGKVIYLVEKGTPEGPLEKEQVHETYTQTSMESAFVHVARELLALGYLAVN